MTRLTRLFLLICVVVAAPHSAAAQSTVGRTRNLLFGIGYLGADARGALGTALGDAQGAGGYLAYPLVRRGAAALRLDLSLVAPAEEVGRFALVLDGQNADVRINTTSNLASAFLGPQFVARVGPLRPYAFGTVGFTRFVYDLFASATVAGEARSVVITTSATRAGGQVGAGLRIPLVRNSGSVQLDAGVLLQRGGSIDVPVRGTLAVDSAGALGAVTTRARLDFRTWRVGIAVVF